MRYEQLEHGDALRDVEIFAAGMHHGFPFDESLVKTIAEDSAEVAATGREPYGGRGHRPKDLKPEEVQALPRWGTMRNIRYKAGKIFTDFVGVPREAAKGILDGSFPKRSVEFKPNFVSKVTGKVYPLIIDYMGWLGMGQPEVTNLGDVGVLQNAEDWWPGLLGNSLVLGMAGGEGKPEILLRFVEDFNSREEEMDPKEDPKDEGKAPVDANKGVTIPEAELTALRTSAEESRKLRDEMQKLGEEKDAQAKRIAELEKRDRERDVKGIVDELVRDGRLVPAMSETETRNLLALKELPDTITIDFAESGATKKLTLFENRVRELRAKEPAVEFGETLARKGDPQGDELPLTASAFREQKKAEDKK